MPSISYRHLFAGLMVTAVLVGCSVGPKLSAEPKKPVNLAGNWLMDGSRSDDVEVMVREAFAAARREDRGEKKQSRKKQQRPPKDGRPDGRRPPGSDRSRRRSPRRLPRGETLCWNAPSLAVRNVACGLRRGRAHPAVLAMGRMGSARR